MILEWPDFHGGDLKMPTCGFCKHGYNFPKGLTYVLIDGKVVYFCSSKCKKNWELKRDPKKTNWVRREKKGQNEEVTTEEVAEKIEIPEDVVEDKKEDKGGDGEKGGKKDGEDGGKKEDKSEKK